VESVIQPSTAYNHSKVPQWTNEVIENSMRKLTSLNKPFKYIGIRLCDSVLIESVTCIFMQRNGAGLHTASSCFWENASDGTLQMFSTSLEAGSSTYRFENKAMYCIVTAFGLCI